MVKKLKFFLLKSVENIPTILSYPNQGCRGTTVPVSLPHPFSFSLELNHHEYLEPTSATQTAT